MDNGNRIIAQMTGGNMKQFLDAHWRQRILVERNCLPEIRSFYTINQFIDDYARCDSHEATYIIDVVNGKRRFSVPATSSQVSRSLAQGSSIALQVLRLPANQPRMPQKWKWMRELYEALFNHFLPGFPATQFLGAPVAAIDIFCTLSASTTGGHYDTGDVFFLALEGEKEWTVEYGPNLDAVRGLHNLPLLAQVDSQPLKETTTVVLSPGDCLYVPPFTYHRVRSSGRSLAVSFGLPAFNAIHVLAHQLSLLAAQTKFMDPLPSSPRDDNHRYLATGIEQSRQLRELLATLQERVHV